MSTLNKNQNQNPKSKIPKEKSGWMQCSFDPQKTLAQGTKKTVRGSSRAGKGGADMRRREGSRERRLVDGKIKRGRERGGGGG
jgi:hypothetical protein